MQVIHEIQQILYVDTPHGKGIALFIIDYGPQVNTVWVVTNLENGKIRHYDTNHITISKNHTLNLKT
jgi:hypothetical protein